MKPLKILSALSAFFAYLLVALSPIVRITGSGLGCGDDWPLCNGRIIPPLDNLAVMIEWGHRLAAAGVSVLVVGVAVVAFLRRAEAGIGGRGGVLPPAALSVVLLFTQIMLGAITVWLELPAGVVVLHMGNALALLAAAAVTAFRALRLGAPPLVEASGGAYRTAMVALGLGGGALLLGALTANLDAGMACTGFPLCSGAVWPSGSGSGLAHIHWTHRLLAYALTLHLVGVLMAAYRRGEPRGVLAAAWLSAGVLAIHVVVAVLMVARQLPMPLRAGHAFLGAAVWLALVFLAWRSAPGRAADAS